MQDHNWYTDIEFTEQLIQLFQLRLEENHPIVYEVLNPEDKEVEDESSRIRRDHVQKPPF